MSIRKTILALGACAGLVACGDTIGEQAVAGGAIGAGAAVLTSGSLVQGAAIGAGANLVACQAELVKCK